MTVKAILKLVKVLRVYSHSHKRDTCQQYPADKNCQNEAGSIQILGTTEDTEITIKENQIKERPTGRRKETPTSE